MRALAVARDGTILITGTDSFADFAESDDLQIVALTPAGARDTRWGLFGIYSHGTLVPSTVPSSIVVQDDRVLVPFTLVNAPNEAQVLSIIPPEGPFGNAEFDPNFGSEGIATLGLTDRLVYVAGPAGGDGASFALHVDTESGETVVQPFDDEGFPGAPAMVPGGPNCNDYFGLVVDPGVTPARDGLLLSAACGPPSGAKVAVRRLVEDRLGDPVVETGLNVSNVRTVGLPTFARAFAATSGAGTTIASAPMRSSPMRSSPMRSSPMRSSPMRSSPMRSSPMRSSPMRSSPMRSSTLSDLPLLNGKSWAGVLDGTPLSRLPLSAVTLGDVFDLFGDGSIGSLTLDDLDTATSPPLRNVSAASWLLLGRPLSVLPSPAGGWPAFVPEDRYADYTLFDLDRDGWDDEDYWATPMPLTTALLGTGVGAAPLARVLLDTVDLRKTGLDDVEIPSGATDLCERACAGRTFGAYQHDVDPGTDDGSATTGPAFGGATIGDLVDAMPGQITLQDLLPGLVAPDRLPAGAPPLTQVLARLAPDPAHETVEQIHGDVSCDGAIAIDVALPGGKIDTSGAEASIPDGSPDPPTPVRVDTFPGGRARIDHLAGGAALASLCQGAGNQSISLRLVVEPPPQVGRFDFKATITDAAGIRSGEGDVFADDDPDPGSTPATAAPIQPGEAVAGFIGSGDSDTFRLDLLPTGASVTVTLDDLPADFDLYVQGRRLGLSLPPSLRYPGTPTTVPDNGADDAPATVTSAAGLDDSPLDLGSLRQYPLRARSTRDGRAAESVSFVVRDGDQGGPYFLTVAGANGASSPFPYSLRVSVSDPPPTPGCIARSTAAPALDDVPGTEAPDIGDAHTLVLWNPSRMAAATSVAQTRELGRRLVELAQDPTVSGAVVPVDTDAGVRSAYAAWDGRPCSPAAANDVVVAVGQLVRSAATHDRELRHVVLVGGDDQLPQARVPDLTSVSNERLAADELGLTNGAEDTPTSAAQRAGMVLTDDPYGDLDPRPWLGGTLAIPDVGLGRLVDTPEEIGDQLDAYLDADGRLRPQRKVVAGYDFLDDAADRIVGSLGEGATRLPSGWTAAAALDAINDGTPAILSINGHYDWEQALAGDHDFANLLGAFAALPARGSVSFTIGCHAGLAAAGAYLSGVGTDWARALTKAGSVFVGNTGYGYGDLVSVAYGERLMDGFARQVADHRSSVGQALMFAKQRYFAETPVPSAYDAKTLQQATFYGLPTYRVDDSPEARSVLPPDEDAGAPREDAFSVDPDLQAHNDDRGRWWQVGDEDPIVAPSRPLQPKTTLHLEPGAGPPAHGALITELTSDMVSDVDPVIARPVSDTAASSAPAEPDRPRTSVFPDVIQRVDRYADPAADRETLTLAAGQFLSDDDAQRLFGHIGGKVLRSASDDWDPPRLTAKGHVDSGYAFFEVTTPVGEGATGGVLLVNRGEGAWTPVTLRPEGSDGTTFTAFLDLQGADTLPTFYAQLRDDAGNVAAVTGKGAGVRVLRQRQPVRPDLTLTSPVGPSGYADDPALVLVDGHGHDVTVEIDGRPVPISSGGVSVTGEGVHLVVATSDDGLTASLLVPVDGSGPELTGVFAAPPNAAGWFKRDAKVRWTCTDAGAGVDACPAATTVGGEGDDLSTGAVAATDRAGNTTTASRDGIRIDRTDPVSTFEAPPTANGYAAPGTSPSLSATDALSGVASTRWRSGGTSGDYDHPPSFSTHGPHNVRFGATDVAGNTEPERVATVTVDAVPPTLTTPRAPSGWVRAFTAEWTCADAGAGVEHCPDPVALPEGRDSSVTRTATDRVGNHSAPATATADVDATAPTLTGQASPAPGPTGWVRTPLTVTWSCADALSGVRTCPGPTPVYGEGDAVTGPEVSVADRAGNTVSVTPGPFKLDPTPPRTTLRTEPDGGGTRVVLAATDATSGVEGIRYWVDSGAEQPYTGPFVVPPGRHKVKYRATDVAGNVEAVRTAPVGDTGLDTTPPVVVSDFTPGWHRGPLTITFSCSDDGGSGVASCPPPITLTGSVKDGSVSSEFASDDAGNSARLVVRGIDIDRTAPVATGTPTAQPNANGWYGSPVTIRFACTDTFSGIAPGGCPAPVQVTSEAADQAIRPATPPRDLAGNIGEGTAVIANLDLTAPALSIDGPAGHISVADRNATLSGEATDALSGIAKVAANGNLATRSGDGWTVSFAVRCGTSTLPIVAKDRAGNRRRINRTFERRC